MPDERRSWTIIDGAGETVTDLRHWIVHLEQTHCSPNTIQAYARHMVDLANYLAANESSLARITVPLYDDFLRWRGQRRASTLSLRRFMNSGRRPLQHRVANPIGTTEEHQMSLARAHRCATATGAAGQVRSGRLPRRAAPSTPPCYSSPPLQILGDKDVRLYAPAHRLIRVT